MTKVGVFRDGIISYLSEDSNPYFTTIIFLKTGKYYELVNGAIRPI